MTLLSPNLELRELRESKKKIEVKKQNFFSFFKIIFIYAKTVVGFPSRDTRVSHQEKGDGYTGNFV